TSRRGSPIVSLTSGFSVTRTNSPILPTCRPGKALTSEVSTLSSWNSSRIAAPSHGHPLGNGLRRHGNSPDRRPGSNTALSSSSGSPMTGRGTSAPITAWSNCSIESLTSTGTAPGSPDSKTPTWPSPSTADQVVPMLAAARKPSLAGIVAVIAPSTKGYAELRDRGHEGRMRQRLQAAAFARVRAPCDRLVPADGAKARTLAASHQARHRLERIAAGDLRHVRAARRVLSTHRQQDAASGGNSRGVGAHERGRGRGWNVRRGD